MGAWWHCFTHIKNALFALGSLGKSKDKNCICCHFGRRIRRFVGRSGSWWRQFSRTGSAQTCAADSWACLISYFPKRKIMENPRFGSIWIYLGNESIVTLFCGMNHVIFGCSRAANWRIQAASFAFTAISDGSVLSWGRSAAGGDSDEVQKRIMDLWGPAPG